MRQVSVTRHTVHRHLLLGLGLSALLLAARPQVASAVNDSRLIVLGFDGADAQLTEDWMNAGELPNLAALRDQGSYRRLTPTNPPQTPVAWSTFATGLDPGATEIFDFLKRDAGSYNPVFAVMTPSKETLLWGDRNPLLFGMVAFVVGFLLGLLVVLLARRRRMRPLAIGGVLTGVLFGAVGAWFAATFVPAEIPKAVNNRKGLTFWDYADQNGMVTRTIRVPTTFPASVVPHGTFLSGLGVPDMRGRVGTPSIYTSRPQPDDAKNEFSIELFEIPRRGTVNTEIIGPENLPFYRFKVDAAIERAARSGESPAEAMRQAERSLVEKGVPPVIKIPMTLEIGDDEITIQTSGNTLSLRPGEWSPWIELDFPFNPLFRASGITRFKLVALDPEVHLYMSSVNLNPRDLPVFAKISHPRSFAKELVAKIGLFKTMGWSIDTWSLQDEHIDEETFLQDVDESVAEFRKMFDEFIEDDDVQLYTQIFYFTDRVQHMLWRLRDTLHPYYDRATAEQYERAILDAYKTMDEIVGKAMSHVDDHTRLIVLSDHGFATWRRAVNLNTWLVREGYMTLTGEGTTQDLEALFGRGDLWPNVDWSRTQAFALGLGYVRLNVLGREPEGTVLPGVEYDRVRREITEKLEAFVDPESGEHPVSKVYTREEMYRPGFDTDLIPDLRVCNNPGYRVSWQSSLGNTPPEILYNVEKKWSGDHCSLDPEFVKGILFASFPLASEAPWIGDIFPTICDLFALEQPDGLHGASLVAR